MSDLNRIMRRAGGLLAAVMLALAFPVSALALTVQATVITRSVYGRAGPDTSAAAVVSLFRDETYPAEARTERGDWIHLNHPAGPVWIPAWTARLSRDVLDLPVAGDPLVLTPPPMAEAPDPAAAGPTLADFWEGRASWALEVADVGLPIGESDTLRGPDGQLWSYLHASYQSAGIVDQNGAEVPFPGCVTLWKSADEGRSFALTAPRCLISCRGKTCTSAADQIDQQQYPRVARAANGAYVMVYEWQAHLILRTSANGLKWSAPRPVRSTGSWRLGGDPCRPWELIGLHPFVTSDQEYDCLAGAPPGIHVDGSQLYVFMAMGKNPGHMGCLTGPLASGAVGLRPCRANPLFTGAASYGPLDASGPAANPYFDFRTIAAADVLRVGERYYMTYEGVRGPTAETINGDSQFALGLARSVGAQIDGPWEKYPGSPLLRDASFNVGIGHADLVVIDGWTYLYTATGDLTRGRYRLEWN